MARCFRILKCNPCPIDKPLENCPRCKGKGEYICDGIIVGTPPLVRPHCNRCGSQKMMAPTGPAPRPNPGVSHPSDLKPKPLPEGYVQPQPDGGSLYHDVVDSVTEKVVAATVPESHLERPIEAVKKVPKSIKTIKSAADLVGGSA